MQYHEISCNIKIIERCAAHLCPMPSHQKTHNKLRKKKKKKHVHVCTKTYKLLASNEHPSSRIYSSWKVDGAIPMYWFIIAPLQRHLLGVTPSTFHYSGDQIWSVSWQRRQQHLSVLHLWVKAGLHRIQGCLSQEISLNKC